MWMLQEFKAIFSHVRVQAQPGLHKTLFSKNQLTKQTFLEKLKIST